MRPRVPARRGPPTFVTEADQLTAGLRAALHRGDQSAGRAGAVPAVVDGARAGPGRALQRRAAPGRRPPVRGGHRCSAASTTRRTTDGGPPAESAERLGAVFAAEGDDAWTAVAAWRTVADALGIADWALERADPRHVPAHPGPPPLPVGGASGGVPARSARGRRRSRLGVVGELDPDRSSDRSDCSAPTAAPAGWAGSTSTSACCSTRDRVARRRRARPDPVSRFPSSDIDLAFVVPEEVPAGSVERTLRAPAATCWSRWGCSTSTGATRWRRAPGAWPTACGSVRSTEP